LIFESWCLNFEFWKRFFFNKDFQLFFIRMVLQIICITLIRVKQWVINGHCLIMLNTRKSSFNMQIFDFVKISFMIVSIIVTYSPLKTVLSFNDIREQLGFLQFFISLCEILLSPYQVILYGLLWDFLYIYTINWAISAWDLLANRLVIIQLKVQRIWMPVRTWRLQKGILKNLTIVI